MSRWKRAMLIAAAAAAATALIRLVTRGMAATCCRPGASDLRRGRSIEDVVEELSDQEKAQLLSELGQHV